MSKSQPLDDKDLQSSEELHKIELINFGTVVQTGVGSYFLKRHNSELDIISLQYKNVADLLDQLGDYFDAIWLPFSPKTLDVSKSYETDKSDKQQVLQTDSDLIKQVIQTRLNLTRNVLDKLSRRMIKTLCESECVILRLSFSQIDLQIRVSKLQEIINNEDLCYLALDIEQMTGIRDSDNLKVRMIDLRNLTFDQSSTDYGDSLQFDSFYIAATNSLISQILIKDDRDKVTEHNEFPDNDDNDTWGNTEDDLVEMFNSKLGI